MSPGSYAEAMDNGGRRTGVDRRIALNPVHVPERRSGLDRRSGFDRRSKRYSHRKDKERRDNIKIP